MPRIHSARQVSDNKKEEATLTSDVAVTNSSNISGQAVESKTSRRIDSAFYNIYHNNNNAIVADLHLLRLAGSEDTDGANFLTCCNLVLKAVAPVDTSSRLCSSVRAASFSMSACSVLRLSMKSLRRCFRPSSHSLYSGRPCTCFFLNFHPEIGRLASTAKHLADACHGMQAGIAQRNDKHACSIIIFCKVYRSLTCLILSNH